MFDVENTFVDICTFQYLLYFCVLKELFGSIAPQITEIRTVANSLPLLLKYFDKSLFFNRISQTD